MSREQSRNGPRVELDKLGNPVFVQVISPDALRVIKPTSPEGVETIHNYLRVYGMENPQALASFERQYLSRFRITPNQPGYDEQLKRLCEDSYSDRVAVAMGRRTAQQADTVAALEGNLRSLCVYINDGPEPCAECEPLNGEEMTYEEFVNEGKLPGDRCLGGDNCLCILQPITP